MINKKRQDLINRICATFCEKMEASIEKKLEQLDKNLDLKVSNVMDNLKPVKDLASDNKEKIDALQARCEVLEQQAKHSSLRFVGLDAVDNNDDLVNTIIKLIKLKMNITCSITDIQHAFYVGKNSANKAVLVQFTNVSKRDEIFNVKKILKNSKILIFEELTKLR